MLPVSAQFSAAEIADIVQVAQAVFIYRGNYASPDVFGSSITSSGDDASGNYPAAGIADGDHVEINMGAPSVADNGIGLSTWKSSTVPNAGSPVNVEIDFNATRTFNYVKFYNYSGDPCTSYALQYWNGSAWVTFAGTSDKSTTPGYTGGLDVYDLYAQASDVGAAGSTISATKVRALVYTTKNSDAAQIVEIEVYYKVDVTNRCMSAKADRQRDWKQVNPMAANVTLQFDNSDRFFSPSHIPTTAETAAGYFNKELTAGMMIQVQFGFYDTGVTASALGYGQGGYGVLPYGGVGGSGGSAMELVNTFIGTIDTIEASSRQGVCVITGRDGMKNTLNQTWSTRLKYGLDLGAAIQYMLNICNVSNYEMNVNLTGLTIPYFYVYEVSAYSVIQQIVQAAGQAQFWYDENGIAQFANLLSGGQNSRTDFLFLGVNIETFTTYFTAAGGSIVENGQTIVVNGGGASPNPPTSTVAVPSTVSTAWQWVSKAVTTNVNTVWSSVTFAAVDTGGATSRPNGYALEFNTGVYFGGASVSLVKVVAGVRTSLANVAISGVGAQAQWTVLRYNVSGTPYFAVYQNATLIIGGITDTTYTSFSYFAVSASGNGSVTIQNVAVCNPIYTLDDVSGNFIFTSPIIDQGATIASEGLLSAGFGPQNAPLTWQTRTASTAGGIPSASWSSVTLNALTQQGQIPSAAAEFIQYRFYFDSGADTFWSIYYTSIAWKLTSASGTIRQIGYDSSMSDVKEKISDSLGGDSSVLNYIEVIAAPLLLTGTTSDVQWTATVGNPLGNISASNPMVVNTGTIQIQAVVAGGMDITFMGVSVTGTAGNSYGAGGTTAFLVTFGTAAGTISISYIHPTKPIITLTITTAGTITNLQLIGQAFSNSSTPIDIVAGDKASQVRFKRRTNQISNNYIPNAAVSQLIANNQLILYRNPAIILSGIEVELMPSVQLTDLAQLTDYNLDLSTSQTWNISGITQEVTKDSSPTGATIKTTLAAVLLPT